MESSKTIAAESATAAASTKFQELHQEKQTRLRNLYEQLDIGKDGKLDIKELATALKQRMPKDADTPSYARQIMSRADTRSENAITFNDFIDYVLEHERKLAITFGDLDKNRDGMIDYEEVKRYLNDLGMSEVTDDQAKAIIAKMVDGKKAVSLEDFQRHFLLYPSSSGEDIAKYWHRAMFIDIGDEAAVVPVIEDKAGWWRHLLAGGVAGAVSRTATAPVDRLKIFMQVYASRKNQFGVFSSTKLLLQEGGLLGLWRGNGVSVMKIVPESAIKFWAYEQAKSFIVGNNRTGQLSGVERLLAGSFAGAVSQTAIYPMEVLKTKLALRKTGEFNHGMLNAMRTLYKTEGLRAFGRGYLPSVIGIIPYAGTELAVYETLKNICIDRYFTNRDPGLIVLLGCGVASSTVAQLVSYPLALVRTRLQAHASNQPVTMLGQFNYIVNQEGVIGLYRGLVPNFMKVLPSVGISYMVYEVVRKWLGVTMT